MSARTLADIKTDAKTLLDIDDDLFITDAQQTAMANLANREVYKLLCRHEPGFFLTETTTTWSSGSTTINLPSVLGADPYQILLVMETASSGAISNTNRPWLWHPKEYRDRSLKDYYRHGLFSWLNFLEPQVYTEYYVQGDVMGAIPIPTSDRYLTIAWVPQPPALSSPTDEVLDGKAESFGDAVMYRLAVLINAKQERQNPMVDQLWAEARDDIAKLARRKVQRNPRVTSRRAKY